MCNSPSCGTLQWPPGWASCGSSAPRASWCEDGSSLHEGSLQWSALQSAPPAAPQLGQHLSDEGTACLTTHIHIPQVKVVLQCFYPGHSHPSSLFQFILALADKIWMSEQSLNGTWAQLGYAVPFALVYTGKYRTEDKLKIQTIHKLNTTQK